MNWTSFQAWDWILFVVREAPRFVPRTNERTAKGPPVIVIAHLSDPHIDSGRRSIERTRAVMTYLDGLPYDLDAVLVTGDIADHGLPSEYEEARRPSHLPAPGPGLPREPRRTNRVPRALARPPCRPGPGQPGPPRARSHPRPVRLVGPGQGPRPPGRRDTDVAGRRTGEGHDPGPGGLPPPAGHAQHAVRGRHPDVRRAAPRRAEHTPPPPQGLPGRSRAHPGGYHVRRATSSGGSRRRLHQCGSRGSVARTRRTMSTWISRPRSPSMCWTRTGD